VIIQALLLSILATVLFYAISQRRRSRLLSSVMMGITLIGGGFVLFPSSTQGIAHAVGVGRGADLVTYCFIVVTLVAIFNLHLRLRASAELITELARSMALASARRAGSVEGEHVFGDPAPPNALPRGGSAPQG
jgi:hypothetical protein